MPSREITGEVRTLPPAVLPLYAQLTLAVPVPQRPPVTTIELIQAEQISLPSRPGDVQPKYHIIIGATRRRIDVEAVLGREHIWRHDACPQGNAPVNFILRLGPDRTPGRRPPRSNCSLSERDCARGRLRSAKWNRMRGSDFAWFKSAACNPPLRTT